MTFQRGIDSRPFSNELQALLPAILEPEALELTAWPVVGVDMSYWQGDTDFSILKGLVDFVILRYAYGNTVQDAKLDAYYRGAIDNKIAVMGYHYLKAGKDWNKHAETSINLLRDYPALYMWGDAEETGGLSKTALDGWLYKYFNRFLELSGGDWLNNPTIGVYTSPNFWNSYLPRTDWAKRLKLWNAHWTLTTTPILPWDWALTGRAWTIWQHSSKGDGHMHGASSTYIDLNRYNGSIEDFNREFSANLEPKPLPEDYMKVKSLYNYLRIRNDHYTSATVKDYMMAGDTTEALEEFISGSDKWIRLGFKQWSAMKYAGKTYLEYVE